MAIGLHVLEPAPVDEAAEQYMVGMRDGVRLATDVYVPEGVGPFPAVLVRLPYDKCGLWCAMCQVAPHFIERGYAFVTQDARGKFRSEGEAMPFKHEVQDGYDTLEWLSALSWSNGIVGMIGDSYYGYTQWAAVASGHPALRAIVPGMTSADLPTLMAGWWDDSVVQLYRARYLTNYWTGRLIYHFDLDWSMRPLVDAFEEVFAKIGIRSLGFDAMLRLGGLRPAAPDPAGHPFEKLKIPVLHSTGWFDNLGPLQMQDYARLRRRPETARLQYLTADATDHMEYRLRYAPITSEHDMYTNEDAMARWVPGSVQPALDFFDVFLKGHGEKTSIPAARWYVGHEQWHTSPCWPPPESRERHLYLGAPEWAASSAQGGTLLPSADSGTATARWVHDPTHLVPSTWGDAYAFLLDYPDESDVEAREDVLTFTAEPCAAPLDLAGPISAVVTAASSAPSMHLFMKLCDVDPDGVAHMVVSGRRLVREVEYGSPVEVALGHTGYRVRPGHCLRLQIASSDFPLYLWHPGTNENPWFATEGVANQQTLATGGSVPSHLRLTTLS